MPVNRIGSATVDVVADTGGFGKGLSEKLRKALAGSEKSAKGAGRNIGRAVADGIGDGILRRAPEIRRKINAMLRGITVTAKVKVNIDVDSASSTLRRASARFRGNFEGEVFGPLKSATGALQGLVGKLAGSGKAGLAGLLVMYEAALFSTAAIADAFNAVGRELLNVVKLSAFLPAGISVAIATAAALKIGLLGVSEAIEAVFSKDPEKLNEALKSLTPSAKSFVLEFQKALPVFDSIKSKVQESLFAPLRGTVTSIVANLGDSVSSGLSKISSSIGSLLASIGAVFAQPETRRFFDSLFGSTSRIINALSGPMSNLVDSFIRMADTALPSLEKLASGPLSDMIQRFSDWINEAIADGRFQEWLDSASRTLGDIKYLIEQLVSLFAVLFDDANLEGKSFLEIVGDLIGDFKDFAASNEGKYALEGIAEAGKIAGAVLIGISAAIVVITASIGSLVHAIRDALEWLGVLERKKNTPVSGVIGTIRKNLPGFADGDIVRTPQVANIAEDGPEVVIPLTKPGRARELARKSGLTGLLSTPAVGNITQTFYLGEEEIKARMVSTARNVVDSAVASAAYGVQAA